MKQGLPKHILIDKSPGETRVAVLREGRLSDVFVERQHRPVLKGSLILGKVQAVKKELNADGLLATCIQHEIDHLDGILFIDYLSKLKKDMIIKKLKKQKKETDKAIL